MAGILDNLAVYLREKYDEIQREVNQNQRKKISGPTGSSELCWELYPTHFGSKISSVRNGELQKVENQNQCNYPQIVETKEDPIQLNPTKYGAIRKVVETKTKKEQVQLDPTRYGASIRKVENKAKEDQNQRIDAQYGFIRNKGLFPSNFYSHIQFPQFLT